MLECCRHRDVARQPSDALCPMPNYSFNVLQSCQNYCFRRKWLLFVYEMNTQSKTNIFLFIIEAVGVLCFRYSHMLYVNSVSWSYICLLCQRLRWFLPVRFCIQQLRLPGPPTASQACLHRPSPTVWSWLVRTRSSHPTNAARCSGKSNRWDSFVVSPFNNLSDVFNSRLYRVVSPPQSRS